MSLAGLKVLLVEDELLILELFEFTLQLHEIEVRSARNVAEAMGYLESWLPEVIITDIGLPEMDGYSFIKLLRSQPATRKIPVIALSGYVSKGRDSLEMDDELLTSISKPVDPDYLIKVLMEHATVLRSAQDGPQDVSDA